LFQVKDTIRLKMNKNKTIYLSGLLPFYKKVYCTMYAILCKVQTHSILYTLAFKYYVFSQAELNRSSKMSAFTYAFGLLLW